MIEFKAWPKTPRLFRDIVVTEKIDGTNAAIVIEPVVEGELSSEHVLDIVYDATIPFAIAAQSRKRLLTLESDNFGFAHWVHDNAVELVKNLGPGRHFGEWWGSGIQRGYGLAKGERVFSLFSNATYGFVEHLSDGLLRTVPVLYAGGFEQYSIEDALDELRLNGSKARPGYDNPEGVIVYHPASNTTFKVLLENDDQPKGAVA